MTIETPAWMMNLRGRFVVFDGSDGSGKTTQWRRFAQYARDNGVETCAVREPGATAIGEKIRDILLAVGSEHEIEPTCEMLLFMASRAQLVTEHIKPSLEQNHFVLADRFVSSTLAYQGTAGGQSPQDIRRVADIAIRSCWPDLVVIFDVDEETAARRLAGSPSRSRFVGVEEPTLFSDRIELRGTAFQKAVREGYLDQAKSEPDRYLVIDAAGSPDTVFDGLIEGIKLRFEGEEGSGERGASSE